MFYVHGYLDVDVVTPRPPHRNTLPCLAFPVPYRPAPDAPHRTPPHLRENCESATTSSDIGQWFTFFILFNNFVPISLYVTLEMVNFIQAAFIDEDLFMYDEGQVSEPRGTRGRRRLRGGTKLEVGKLRDHLLVCLHLRHIMKHRNPNLSSGLAYSGNNVHDPYISNNQNTIAGSANVLYRTTSNPE